VTPRRAHLATLNDPHAAARADKALVPRLALTVEEACAALSVSWDTWREHIEPGVRLVRVGRRKLVQVRELERWLDTHSEAAGELG
jgi:excisionase family DNA binding protein